MSLTLQQAQGNSYFFSSRCSIGAYIKDKKVILIDSSIEKSTAQNLDKVLQEQGLTVVAIINTHHHADHCGGNNYFQQKYKDLQIFASGWEKLFIENPSLGPICFCSGAAAFQEMRTKFLEPESSLVTHPITPYQDQTITILDETFRIIALPGHTPGMIGVITPDNVLYCGDAFFGDETFDKHGVLFYTNISDTLASLQKLKDLTVDACVFYHGGLSQDIQTIADKHVARILETADFIMQSIAKEQQSTPERITADVMQEYKVPNNIMQIALTKTCINAYLAYLEREKQVKLAVQNGMLVVNTCTPMTTNKNDTPWNGPENIKTVLRQKNIDTNIVQFAESTRTAQDAATAIGCEVAQIAKSLVFRTVATNKAVLVIASGVNRVNEQKIEEQLHEKIGKADANFVKETTGFAIGGVSPVGHKHLIDHIFIDQDLLQFDTVWAAAGTPFTVFSLKSKNLQELTHGKVVSVS